MAPSISKKREVEVNMNRAWELHVDGVNQCTIAEELGCERIILSNFPGGFDNTETWEKAIDRNVELILGAVAR